MSSPTDGQSPAAAHEREHGVTTLELFFDLVFVFAITQVTVYLSDNLNPGGYLRGLLILWLVWWAWVTWSWLGTTVRIDEIATRVAMFAAMPALLVMAIGMPEWFADAPGGFDGTISTPVVVAAAYFGVRITHRLVYLAIIRDEPVLRAAVFRLTIPVLIATGLIIAGAFLPTNAHVALMIAAIAVDLGGSLLGRRSGWRVNVTHFSERHGLIVIIALGESVVSIGVGASGQPLGPQVFAGIFLGLAVVCGLWWLYFDWFAYDIEHRLGRVRADDRARTARDAYSYLHVLLIGGIVVLAVALKKMLKVLSDGDYGFAAQLPTGAAWSLGLGLTSYLLGTVAIRRRVGAPLLERVVAALLCLAVAPLALIVPAVAAVLLVVVLLTALIAVEHVRYGRLRPTRLAARS